MTAGLVIKKKAVGETDFTVVKDENTFKEQKMKK